MSNVVFWFRRDLRFDDNTALLAALARDESVIPLFIFDEMIINELSDDDPRIGFIHESRRVSRRLRRLALHERTKSLLTDGGQNRVSQIEEATRSSLDIGYSSAGAHLTVLGHVESV